ncbi:hypothetical protein [Roseiflexus sp.]|uniref:hypothetical protein n=1 Tax=Roseiflexus sp. TaxID=2562120 RepID=UPI0021DBA3AE|nr:hypothetical protein [Roseiflexus sp.]GIW00908.1 MAG: hypothetical protein KatS3mg058_2311 [Roseiflexus sp.]
MITRDKAYFGLAALACLIQSITLALTYTLHERKGFSVFWIGLLLSTCVSGSIVITSSRAFIASSRYAASAVVLSMTSLSVTLLWFLS